MKIALLILIASFALAIVAAALLRRDLSPKTDPMSSYLSGPFGIAVDLGYVALAAAIAALPSYLGAADWFAALCYVTAAGVLLVVGTHRLRIAVLPPAQTWILQAHKVCAAIAFIGATVLLFTHGLHHQVEFLFAVLAPLSLAAFYWIRPDEKTLPEWTYAALITAGLISLALSP